MVGCRWSLRGATWGRSVRERHATRRRSARAAVVATTTALVAGLFLTQGTAAAAAYDPGSDPYGMAAVTAQMGVATWWDAGFTGQGVDVAVIDTGVARVAGLDGSGKVIDGPDLSLESQAPNLTRKDTNGHGTFMAGLIAGHDASLTSPYGSASPAAYRGVAPDARIVALKVATADGGADVSQVIAGIYWVIQHKDDNGMKIRVLNLSYGTNSTQPASVDPLSYAVEQAWKAGIVVVAAAGNTGYQRGSGAPGLSDPAYNPLVIGVGGYDTMGTADPADDAMGTYSASGCGSGCKRPDFVAPGSHLQGLRVANGFLDATFPSGRLGTSYFRGSGTSQAAAITSGAVALVLSKYPLLTPEQVKLLITKSAAMLPDANHQAQGHGRLDLVAMAAKTPRENEREAGSSSGTGTLEAARGQDHLTRDGVVLAGERDIFGHSFDSQSIAAGSGSWSGGRWNGSTWSGSTWSGSTWSGSTWSGSTWSGSTWSGSTWSGSTWSGSTWSGSTWSGSSWSGQSWSGATWATGSWT